MAYDEWSIEGREGTVLDRIERAADTVLGALLVPIVLVLAVADRIVRRD